MLQIPTNTPALREPWNKGRLIGQKTTLETQGGLGDSYLSADCGEAS